MAKSSLEELRVVALSEHLAMAIAILLAATVLSSDNGNWSTNWTLMVMTPEKR